MAHAGPPPPPNSSLPMRVSERETALERERTMAFSNDGQWRFWQTCNSN
jgi:hypothetical protein